MIKDDLTLIVLVHNNQQYLPRVLEHYRSFDCRILIADSSRQAYEKIEFSHTLYAHLPQPTLLQKMAAALHLADTEYVALVGVDDFMVASGLEACYDFLQSHPGFVSAQGNSILYRRQKEYRYMELLPMYPPEQLDFEIGDTDPFQRLQQIFHPYRTIFCAVHRTRVMREGYDAVDKNIRNLFLNEYLTAIVPMINGRHRERPVFYQVRESADDSGDKLTPNLDRIFADENLGKELDQYLQSLAPLLSKHNGKSPGEATAALRSILKDYADKLAAQRAQSNKEGIAKRVGKIIMNLPLGKNIVINRRLKQQRAAIAPMLRTEQDRQSLEVIKKLITRHAPDIA